MKNKDIRARVYELASGKSQATEHIKAEIEKMTAITEKLQADAEEALNSGDFEKYKASRREAQDLKDYVDGLAKRLINVTVNLSDAEQDEIRDELHAGYDRLENETRAKLNKLLPELEAIQATYNREFNEYLQAIDTWNEITGSDHRATLNNTGVGRLLEQVASLMRPKNIYGA